MKIASQFHEQPWIYLECSALTDKGIKEILIIISIIIILLGLQSVFEEAAKATVNYRGIKRKEDNQKCFIS